MGEQGVVVVIRLSDVAEVEQPDPLCLRREDLSKWLHLEVMLRNMYRDPPQAIRVTYCDNEGDWVQISCDEELAEAVSMTHEISNILEFQVRRLDPVRYFESTLPPTSATAPAPIAPPSTQVEEEYLHSIALEPLVYPHPSGPPTPVTTPNGQELCAPLIYPHPTPSGTKDDTPQTVPNGNVLLLQANGKTASIEGRPDLSTDEKIAHLKSMMSPGSPEANPNVQGLNSLSSGSVWEQASCLRPIEKLRFLKGFIPSQGDPRPSSFSGGEANGNNQHEQPSVEGLLVEPLCADNGSLGKHMLSNQDPFETVPPGRPYAADLEQVHLHQPLLTPLKTDRFAERATRNVSLEIEADCPKSDHSYQHAARPGISLAARSPHQQPTEKMRICKTPVTPPVPLPRTLQMMEGAQSGANAVAIEIPDSYHGAAHKEEDVTASGGASCTSASAETGEMAPDGSPHAAALGRQMKSVMDPSAVSTISESRLSGARVPLHPKKQASEEKKKSESRKLENRGKKKESSGKELSSKKKSSSEKMKKNTGATKKEDKTIKADVESGEKTVSDVKSEASSSPYKEIVKYMRRMKKELHSNIVKDVAKQTDKLMKKNFERSMSYDSAFLRDGFNAQQDVHHKGILCDCCNNVIYGIRYKCGNCPDFDLCAKCETLPSVHDTSHVFLKLRRPVRNIPGESPLLQKNIYYDSTRMESVSVESSDGFQRLSRQSSVDVPASPKDDVAGQEVSKWYWDSCGTEHSDCVVNMESMPKLSRSEIATLYKMLQEEAEDLTVPKQDLPSAVEAPSKTSEDVIEKDTTELVQAETPLPVDNVDSGEVEKKEEEEVNVEDCTGERETSEYKQIGNDEDDVEEFDEASGSFDENFNLTEGGNLTSEESDSSDDFCVIDPPSREEFEACGMEFSAHSELMMPLLNPYTALEKEQCVPDTCAVETDSAETQPQSFYTVVNQESTFRPSEESATQGSIDLSEPPIVTVEETVSHPEGASVTDTKKSASQEETDELTENNACGGGERIDEAENDSVIMASASAPTEAESVTEKAEYWLMGMSADERRQHLLSVETLKKRVDDLEHQLKEKTESGSLEAVEYGREKDVQLILQAKQKKAAMENEKLEMMKMKEVASKLESWQSVQEMKKRDENIRLQQEKAMRYQEFAQKRGQDQEQVEAKSDLSAPDEPTSSPGSLDNGSYQQTTKDMDSQTNPNIDPATQASQMIQQFTHGVSKAATSAYCTAKDVIYSLQAKQFEKKTATRSQKPASTVSDDSWTPPAHVWTPPKNDFVPPKSEWTPPKQEWTPPKQEWTPPKSEWKPPSSSSKPASSGGDQQAREDNSRQSSSRHQKKETNRHSQDSPVSPTPPILTIPLADSALRQEILAMQKLMEMGFANREQNRKLLQKFDGDLERVVQCLIQEESGCHWALDRH